MGTVKKYSRELVCKLAYLLGISEERFRTNFEDWKYTWNDFEAKSTMRVVHELSALRNIFIRNYKVLDEQSAGTISNQLDNDEFFDKESLDFLSSNGICIYKANTNSKGYIKIITDLIMTYVPFLKQEFPNWCPFKSIVQLFRLNTGNIAKELNNYSVDYKSYPYQLWVGLNMHNYGYNMLHNDKSLLQCIFKGNQSEVDKFEKWLVFYADSVSEEQDIQGVSASGSEELIQGRTSFTEFVDTAEKTLVVVDCENTSLSTVISVIRGIKPPTKGYKIVLVDDDKSLEDWESVAIFTDIPVVRIKSERVLASKSLVDMRLALEVQKEVFVNNVTDVVLILSDSDYCCLIEALQEFSTNFFIIYESDRISEEYLTRLTELNVNFSSSACFDFIDVKSERSNIITSSLLDRLNMKCSINVGDIIKDCMEDGIHLTDEEAIQLRDKLMRDLEIRVSTEGNCYFILGK